MNFRNEDHEFPWELPNHINKLIQDGVKLEENEILTYYELKVILKSTDFTGNYTKKKMFEKRYKIVSKIQALLRRILRVENLCPKNGDDRG